MKKIVTLSMIKNEADIVETFVRYTMNFASKMFFIDNGCSDGSINILKELIKEGFDIEIYTEANVFYEQYLLENKYIRKITKEHQFDFLIPLDIDEFLACDDFLLDELDRLPMDEVIILKWRTYCILSDNSNGFFLDRITHVRMNEDIPFTKIILPYTLIRNYNILVIMGHHEIECESEIQRKHVENIYIAHFPVRSMEQIQLKAYQGVITQLMSSYRSAVIFQWSKIYRELKSGQFNLVKYSMEYEVPAEQDFKKIIFIEKPFDYSWCKINVKPRFQELQNRNILDIIYELLQVIAIKSIVNEKKEKVRILIYGTGGTAERLFRRIDEDEENYNILAYIDSDIKKEYSKFRNKLIISPGKIKYIKYDYIVIASIYFDEIYNILLENGVKEDKIISKYDIVEQQILALE